MTGIVRRSVVLCGGLLAVLSGGVPAAGAAQFQAGAATSDITPRVASAGDPNGFTANPLCTGMTGHRIWADDEPYVDAANKGYYVPGDPVCDLNHNGRHDQIFSSGATVGSPRPASAVHDPLQARAFAVSDGVHTDVVVSVAAQGLFNTYIDRMVAQAKALAPTITDMIVSANHNESSPDTVGIYGGPAPMGSPAGLQSGIDDYYMTYLVAQVAKVAAQAANSLRPATLWARQFPVPPTLSVELSDNWPTTGPMRTPTAIDPKFGVLQARGASGAPIFTVMSAAVHNQEIGHSGTATLSSDWPGYFEGALDSRLGGTNIFLVGDNGSEEDPRTVPPVPASAGAGCPGGCYPQAQATGLAFADAIAAQAPQSQQLSYGPLRYSHREFCVPIENNLFKVAAVAGLFGERKTYINQGGVCVAAAGPATGPPDSLQTTVGLLDVGPDLQLLANPGEAFPGLVLGSPWSVNDVPGECNTRANPPVPTRSSHALFRFQVGLANDLIGYEIPAWAYISNPGALTTLDIGCVTDAAGKDSNGHQHKLESEGVGPIASNAVATNLAGLVTGDAPDPSAQILRGRYLRGDGSYSQFPQGTVGILVAPNAGPAALDPSFGLLVGTPASAGFGSRPVDANGFFMDYDGQPQTAADVTTRGMIVFDSGGCVANRYYLDEFPALDTSRRLGAQRPGAAVIPAGVCTTPGLGGVPGVQAGAAQSAGLPPFGAGAQISPPAASIPGTPGATGPAVRPGVGCLAKRLNFRLGASHHRPIVRARVYLNGKLFLARRHRRLTHITLRLPAGRYTLRIDTFTKRGLARRSVRIVRGCTVTKPHTKGHRP